MRENFDIALKQLIEESKAEGLEYCFNIEMSDYYRSPSELPVEGEGIFVQKPKLNYIPSKLAELSKTKYTPIFDHLICCDYKKQFGITYDDEHFRNHTAEILTKKDFTDEIYDELNEARKRDFIDEIYDELNEARERIDSKIKGKIIFSDSVDLYLLNAIEMCYGNNRPGALVINGFPGTNWMRPFGSGKEKFFFGYANNRECFGENPEKYTGRHFVIKNISENKEADFFNTHAAVFRKIK